MAENAGAHLKNDSDELLFEEYFRTKDTNIRNKLVTKYLYIAEVISKKFLNRGVEYDDLFQVASLALIKAIERYDVTKGYKFSSFATPTIVGEIKNYFRDKSRIIRMPRKESEYLKKIENAKALLSNKLGRTPKPEEIAEFLDISTETVLELMETGNKMKIASLDFFIDGEGETDLMAVVGEEEKNYKLIEDRDFVERAMNLLNEQEKKVIYERFYNRKSQREVSEELGVSQMYISRLERKIITRFRRYLRTD